MSLILKIKEDRMSALKARNALEKNVLTVLLGDIENISKKKQLSDEDVVAMIKKYIENAKVMYNIEEVWVLDKYLPRQLTDEEMEEEVNKAINLGFNNIGLIMKHLKENFSGMYDGRTAIRIIGVILKDAK